MFAGNAFREDRGGSPVLSRYILAIDPGNVQSAYTLLDTESLRPVAAAIVPNDELLNIIAGNQFIQKDATDFVIEMVASYGMAVGAEVFETVFWIGRFYAAAEQYAARYRVKRMEVKMNLCHNSRAKDANIRQALIDRFGGVGTKKAPGWFYGFKADMWAAYAVGVTFADGLAEPKSIPVS
jgi:hypothetical protein